MMHDISDLWKQMYMYLDTELVKFYKHINSYTLTKNLLQVYTRYYRNTSAYFIIT